jgi:predicted  nucleic acid-binding Zn-ribbon protein
LKEGLEKLYELQQLDDKIREQELSLKQIPEIIAILEQERDGKADIIESTKRKLSENVKAREKLEKDILLVKDKIKKYKEQMNKATTNKEYQGFMAEIKFEEDNISTIEEKVIEKMLESDEIMKEIRESEEEFNKISAEYNQKITDLKSNMEYSKTRLAEFAKERSTVREKIPVQLLKIYDNIAGKKLGKAVSLVESEFCGVCNVGIRPQRVNELITSKQMFTCDSCGRILFYRKAKLDEPAEKDNKKNSK